MKAKLYIILFILLLVSCNTEDDSQKSCLADPTGTIVNSKVNVTAFHEPNSSNNLLQSIELSFEDETQILTLEDYSPAEFQFFTKWQILEFTSIDKLVIQFENGETKEYLDIPGLPNSNEIVLVVKQASIEFNGYIPCNDTP